MTVTTRINRRNLLLAAASLAPIAAVVGCTPAAQQGIPELQADDPVARSLLYYPNTRDVPANHPLAASHTPEQKCAGCIHGRGVPGESLLPCPTFPGRLVNANGWCSVWAAG